MNIDDHNTSILRKAHSSSGRVSCIMLELAQIADSLEAAKDQPLRQHEAQRQIDFLFATYTATDFRNLREVFHELDSRKLFNA